MHVIVTRPRVQAAEWVQMLAAHGVEAVALPLIEIVAPPDPAAVVAQWTDLASRQLVVFVSPNAATAFFERAPPAARWPAATRAASPGPGTTRTLIGLGVPPQLIDAPAEDAPQFDSEALWARLQTRDWRNASVLVVRGTRGRNWLAARLVEQGARVEAVAAYERTKPSLDADARRLLADALAAPCSHLWLFSSSEAIDHLIALGPPLGGETGSPWRDARALATHPRIAVRAREAGFGGVVEALPTPAAVVACIQSIRP